MEDSSGGHRWILVSSSSLDVILFPLFKFRTLNLGIVINNFQTWYCMKSTKYCKLVLIIGSWMYFVDGFEFFLWDVLDGTVWNDSHWEYLVSKGRQVF